MGKLAFLFAGQGAQAPGMGQSLCQSSAAAAEVFRTADEIRPGTSGQCFTGTAEELAITVNTQPCVYAVGLAAAQALAESGVAPDGAAGFSLGELAALTFAGSFTQRDGFALVCGRARMMQEAGTKTPSGMAAVLRMEDEAVEALCAQFEGLWPVNYNAPGQLAVSGKAELLDDFCAAVKQARGVASRLAVSGAFHSPIMAPAARTFAAMLADYDMKTPDIPVYANHTARPYTGDSPKKTLAVQIESPVLWKQTIQQMALDGFDTFVEVGPGKTLRGLVKRILPEARTYNVQTAEDLALVVQELQGAKAEGESA